MEGAGAGSCACWPAATGHRWWAAVETTAQHELYLYAATTTAAAARLLTPNPRQSNRPTHLVALSTEGYAASRRAVPPRVAPLYHLPSVEHLAVAAVPVVEAHPKHCLLQGGAAALASGGSARCAATRLGQRRRHKPSCLHACHHGLAVRVLGVWLAERTVSTYVQPLKAALLAALPAGRQGGKVGVLCRAVAGGTVVGWQAQRLHVHGKRPTAGPRAYAHLSAA